MTASPTNFSTVPPWCSIAARERSKYRTMIARTVSGSTRSPSSVEPTTSQNRSVATLRRSGRGSTSSAPQAAQNRASSGFCLPH